MRWPPSAPSLPLRVRDLGGLILCLFVCAGLHIGHVPVWALAACLVLGFWRYRIASNTRPLPGKILRLALTGAAFVAVLVTYESFLGRDPGVTALILFSALKLLELRSFRDFMVVIFLCFFLLLGVFLFEQSLFYLLSMAAAVLLLLAVIVRANLPVDHDPGTGTRLGEMDRLGRRQTLKLVGLALPLVAVMFFVFPRTSGPLWDLPQGGMGWGRSGFGEFLRPGYIAWVAQSEEPAFRVLFPEDAVPAHKDLYFRGLVLWFTDGRYWMQGIFPFRPRPREEADPRAIVHDVILEPHGRHWLFALDRPVSVPSWAGQLPGWIIQTRNPVKRPLRYRVHSRLPDATDDEIHPMIKKWALQLPQRLNPRIRDLADSFRQEATDDAGVVEAGLEYFRQSEFTYTLRPGLLNRDDPLTDFLFNTRRGFCEHYAASFGLLMRAARIPTRVVVGYQGGKFNPVGGYLMVRQAEAHAWTEVWLSGRGWVRIDPTAVVSPERVEYGIDITRSISRLGAVSEAERSEVIRRAMRKGVLRRLWDTLKNFWDNLNSNWNYWVVSYDSNQQQSIMTDLGMGEAGWITLAVILVFTIGLLIGLISFLISRRQIRLDPLTSAYRTLCRKAAKAGKERLLWEGPMDYRARLSQAFPKKSRQIEVVFVLFIHLRYGMATGDGRLLRRFTRAVRRFRF